MMIDPYKGRTLDPKRRVEVYRNVNKPGVCYSVRQDGKVVGHARMIGLRKCHFHVNEAGRQRVLKTGKKNVHAYVTGFIVKRRGKLDRWGEQLHAKYNPKLNERFQYFDPDTASYKPVIAAMGARLCSSGLSVWFPRA